MKNIEKLEKEFVGTGEVKEMLFKQVNECEFSYIYEVTNNDTIHYELIEKNTTPKCLDFEKKIFSETDFKEVYAKSNSFGVCTWTFKSLKMALIKQVILEKANKDEN